MTSVRATNSTNAKNEDGPHDLQITTVVVVSLSLLTSIIGVCTAFCSSKFKAKTSNVIHVGSIEKDDKKIIIKNLSVTCEYGVQNHNQSVESHAFLDASSAHLISLSKTFGEILTKTLNEVESRDTNVSTRGISSFYEESDIALDSVQLPNEPIVDNSYNVPMTGSISELQSSN